MCHDCLPMLADFQRIDIWYFWLQLSKITESFFYPSELAQLFYQLEYQQFINANKSNKFKLSQ